MPGIIINDTVNLIFKTAVRILVIPVSGHINAGQLIAGQLNADS